MIVDQSSHVGFSSPCLPGQKAFGQIRGQELDTGQSSREITCECLYSGIKQKESIGDASVLGFNMKAEESGRSGLMFAVMAGCPLGR